MANKTPKKRWIVSGQITISVHTEVEADTQEGALEEANSRGLLSLCHQCAHGSPTEEWVTSGELDGTPEEVIAEALS